MTAICNPISESIVCPNCISVAVHFAFFNNLDQKIMPKSIYVIRNKRDTFYLKDSVSINNIVHILSRDYYVYGSVGTYQIIVKDSLYNEINIDNIIVNQNMEYEKCGELPISQHIKIRINSINLGKSNNQNESECIIERKTGGPCGDLSD